MYIEHINISAPLELLGRVRDFYCNVFGVKEGFRPHFSRNGFWLYAGDKAIIHLTESNKHYRNKKQGYFDHVAFRMKGLIAMQDNLSSLGIKYSTNHLPEVDMTQLFFEDPSGTGVEINFVNESSNHTLTNA